MNPRDEKFSAENEAKDEFSSTPAATKLISLNSAQLCQLFDHCYLYNLEDFVHRHKLTGFIPLFLKYTSPFLSTFASLVGIHLQDGVENIQDLIELGLNKLTAKALYKRIIAWKDNGLPGDFDPSLTEPTPIHRDSSAPNATGQPTTVADENELDDDYVDALADFDPTFAEPTIAFRGFSESEEISASNAVSAASVEVPAPVTPPTVNLANSTTEDNKNLDDDYVAAAYCGDRAATDRIVAAVENGNHLAEAYLGNLYDRDGTLVGQDRAKAETIGTQALPWLTENATKGNMFAQFNLAMCYLDGRGVTKNEKEAVRLLYVAAEHGHAAAQNLLGWCYDGGTGVTKDEKEAAKYYKLAADQGHAGAQCNLGVCYQEGTGVAKDDTQAVRYYQLAADQNYALAQYNLGVCYAYGTGVAKDETQAVRYYQLAADQNYAQAQCNLGVCYKNGTVVAKDGTKAVRYYQLAADQGNAQAQYNLGICYANGNGVAKDETKAVHYYQLAADHGYAQAQWHLGWCYANGNGVAKDETEAVRYYQLAADQGYERAQCNLGWCFQHGSGVTKDETEAVRYYKLAAGQGQFQAQYNLGVCYEHGKGVCKDKAEGIKYYKLAAAQNHTEAQRKVDLLEKESAEETNPNNGQKKAANLGQGNSSSSAATESKE